MPATVHALAPASLLRLDPELADALPAGERARATAQTRARRMRISTGRWQPQPLVDDDAAAGGALLVGGVLLCRAGPERRTGSEVLGEGDVICPWRRPADPLLPPDAPVWTVLEPVTAALLDAALLARTAAFPSIVGALLRRQARRARTTTTLLGIARYARVEDRLTLLFRLLAERWGRVTPAGVRLSLPLSHAVLADLVAAQRQTVSTAISHLERTGTIARDGDGFLLRADAAPLPGPAPSSGECARR